MSPRFLVGDELGKLKSLCPIPSGKPGQEKYESKIVSEINHSASVQALATNSALFDSDGSQTVAAAFSDGSACTLSLKTNDEASIVSHWRETRLRAEHKYIGLAVSDRATISCTSNGALRMTPLHPEQVDLGKACASLPTRLRDWRLHATYQSFAYGGDEVDLSVWDTERAFQSQSQNSAAAPTATDSKKRKRDLPLFCGETWRAKNSPNDFLGLRQPVRITSLAYLSESTPTQLLVGTEFGDVRQYDTRATRGHVTNWTGIGKIGGIKLVEKGLSAHEIFVADNGYNLYSVDLRNGYILYGYKGLAGSVTSLATSPTVMVSTGMDRYARIHSVFPPPVEEGQRQERKGEVMEKVYMNSLPTTVIWTGDTASGSLPTDINSDYDEMWESFKQVDDA